MNNVIKLSEIKQDLNKVFVAGYGDTIQIIINGEYYELINDLNKGDLNA